MTITLSATKLNLLRECPRCFWLAMVKNLKRPSGPRSSVPVKMDAVIKQYFNTYRMQNELPPILNGQIHGHLAVNMPKTLQWQVDKETVILGRPDDFFVLESNATVPLDHKTKASPPDEVHPAYRLQLSIYSYLLRMNGYKTENKAFLAYYCPSASDLTTGMSLHCDVREVKTDLNQVISMIRRARSILNRPMPEAGNHCSYCIWVQLLIHNKVIPEAAA